MKCKNCGESITWAEDYDEWVHRAVPNGFVGEPLCGGVTTATLTAAASGNGVYAEPEEDDR